MAKNVTVTKYKDNKDGTTTNYYSDGTSDTGTYSKAGSGSLNFNPNQTSNLNNQVSQLNTALAGLNKARGTSFKALTPVNTTIQADKLGKAQPFTLNKISPTTGVDSMLGEFETGAQDFQDQYSKTLADRAKTTETAKTSSKSRLMQSILGSKGEAELTDQAYQDVDPVEAELNDINDQIRREQVGLQRRVEALEKNPQGLFGGALEDEINKVKTDSVRKQADLSIVQMAVQGRYDSAISQANRKVDVMLERQKAVNDALRLDYEDNKDLFTQAEQRQFETMQSDRERGLDAKEAELKAVNELALMAQKEGAPTALVQQALATDTQAEAMALIGGYIGLQDRLNAQASRANIYSTINERNTPKEQEKADVEAEEASQELNTLLNQYRDLLKGQNIITANFPGTKSAMASLKGQITAVYKRAEKLGTLDAGVQKLIDGIIPDPSRLSVSSLSNKAQLDALDNFITNQGGTVDDSLDDNQAYQLYLKRIGGK